MARSEVLKRSLDLANHVAKKLGADGIDPADHQEASATLIEILISDHQAKYNELPSVPGFRVVRGEGSPEST